MNTENQIKQKLAEDFLLQKIKSVQDIEMFQAKGTPVLKKETVALEPDAINEIYGIARENSFSEYLLYLTAYAILLNKYFNHHEYLIVSPDLILPERPVTEDQTLFFKAAANPENTLKEIIKGIKEEVQATLRYAAYDYSEVEPELLKNEGIFQYGFLFSELSTSSGQLSRSKLVLNILKEKEGGVTAEVTYDAGIFDKEFIVQFLGHYKNITRQIKSGLDTPVHEIDVLSDGEKEVQLSAHAFHTVTYPHQATIQEIFEKIVLKYPDHIAVSFEGKHISYKELNSQANQLAHYLRKSYAVKGDTLIGLMGAPSEKLIVAILAILKSGGAYVPIDPDYPGARINHTVTDSGMRLLLVDSQEIAEKNTLPCEVVSLENENIWRDAPVCNPELINVSTDMAYVIYTSGSTGVPKGVMVEHKNVVQLLCNDQFQFDVDSTDVWTLFHSVCFDFSVWEIFGAILYGGSLVVISKDTARSPEKYVDVIEQEKVTVVNQIPTTFKNVASEILGREDMNLHIRYVIFGGDALNPVALKAWHEKYPDVKLINMYGITETTVHVTYKEIGTKEIAASLSNIGYPLAPMGIFIMDDHHHLKPANTVGEIVVSGEGVTRGYLNREELNKKHFIENPYNTREKLYCSGDLGLRLSSGEIIYVGRKDKQIKIRGYRIEIREIEHVLLSHDLIQDAVIVGHEGSDGEKELAAYLTARSPLNINQLRTHLAEKLPAYMIPSYFVQLERMPLTSNGKVDRKALPHPGIGSLETGEEFVAPTNDLEQKLADLWSNVLAKEQVGITDNYFALGGDSMKAVKLIVEINKILSIRIGIGALFTFQTIRELVGHIKEEQQKQNPVDVLTIGLQKIEKLKEEIIQLEADKLPDGYTDIYPVSNIEKGMIYSSILNEDEYIFYDQFAFQLEINKTEQFGQAILALVQRHDMLRTKYFISTFSEPVKVVMDDIDLPYTVEDLRGRSKADQKEHIKRYRAEDLKIRLTFNGDILWRLKAFQLSDRHFYLVWSTHHALLDGWSEMIFYTDLSRMLAGTDALVDLPTISHTYKHYAAIELGRDDNEKIKEFWNEKLAGYTRNKLPFNYSGKRKQDTPGVDRFSAAFDPHILKSFETIAEQNNVSLRSVFLSAYLYLLNIICAENDVVAGIVSHDRPAIEDSDKILGCFLNVIPVRLDLKDIKDVKSLIKAVNSYLVEARPNEMYLADIARAIGEKASNANNPIFDCLLNFVNFHNVEEWQENEAFDVNHDVFGNDAELGNEGMTNTLFDLEVSVTEQNLFVILRYRKAYFDRGDMERAWNLFARILESFAAGIDTPLHSELLLSNEDKQEILHDFNDTVVPYSATKTMHRLFEEKAAQIPQHTALEQEDASITYEELNTCANQIARQLLKNGVKNGDNVALITGRNFDMIKAMLGILKAGASYVPVDPEYPLDRQGYIIENSDVSCVLVDASYPIAEAKGELRFVDLRDDSIKDNDVTNLDIEKPATDLAYTIYTSGSTGRPKGVMIEHHSAVNLIEWVNNEFAINENDKLLFITSMCFDLSVYDIFGMLAGGGTVVIARESEVKDVTLLENLIRDKGITFWDSVPTTMNYLVREMEAAGKTESIESLRLIFMSGDWIPVDLKERIHPYFPHARVISLGGATEGTVWSNYFPIEKVEPEWASIPYGKPLANNFFYILDDNLQPVPKGVMGELFIGGVGVARGYANEPEKTSYSFVKDPFHPDQGGMMYRTGDLGRLMPDGNMEFLGRKDHQVKIRGYRVELGEIESCLTKHPAVKEAVVMARKDKAGNSYLCAYLVAGKEVSNAALREHILAQLPAYMAPSYYIMLEALPLTPNGKINRKALPEPEAGEVGAGTAYLAPRNELEEKLAGLWRKILNRSKVGVHDNFMEIGAHSLSIGAFVNQVFREFDISLSIGDVFEQPTIAGVAALMATMQDQEEEKLQVVEGEYFDLSNAQRRLWIVSQIEDNPVAYHMPAAHRFKGKLDMEVFKKVFDTLIERHESLRTLFVTVDGEPKQYISDPETFNFSLGYTDVRTVKDKDAHVEQLITREAHTKFNLEKGPLVRAGIIHKEQDEYVFLFTMHHIISDGWSLEVLAEEIFILYDAYIHDRPNPLTPLRVQYKDFAAWQNDQLRGDKLQAHQQYWTNEYQGEIPVLELPADKPRPRVKTYNSYNHVLSLDKQISNEVKTFARNKEASIFMVLLASVKALLHRYSGQDDIIVGSPVSGRDNQELENQVGFYLNILTFRTLFEEEESFASLVENIRNKAVEHYKHQVYPFDRLVEDLQLSRDTSRSALFDVLVVSHDISLNTFEHTVEGMKDITLLGTEETLPQNKYDISIYFHDTEEGIKVKFSYNQDLYNHDRIERMAAHYQHLLRSMLSDSTLPLTSHAYTLKEEQDYYLETFNATETTYSVESTLHGLFEAQAALTPDHVALRQSGEELTYGELNARANRLARYLQEQGVENGDNVGLITGRSFDMIIGMYGILKCGGAYVPIDPSYPLDRQQYILQNSEVSLLVADAHYPIGQASDGTNYILLAEALDLTSADTNLELGKDSHDLAYTIYTSGSTGLPKGVMIAHHSAVNLIEWVNRTFNVGSNDRLLFITSMCFDLSVYDIFGILASGGSLVIAQQEEVQDVTRLKQLMQEEQITFWDSVPTTMNYLVSELEASEASFEQHDLRLVFMSGDWIPVSLPDRLKTYFPNAEVISLGGATEGTVWSNYYPVSKVDPTWASIPYGKPISNNYFYILDEGKNLVPQGVIGELYIGGVGVALGYANDPEKTAYSYVEDPFQQSLGGRMYRTGDLGRMMADGNMEFLGRKDQQVKIRGYRVEPGEVENVLMKHELIEEQVVIARSDSEGTKHLVAYYRSEEEISTSDLRDFLGQKLPSYMLPGYFVKLDVFPLNSNGKIDRKQLPSPQDFGQLSGTEYVAPRTAQEQELAGVWSSVLGLERVGLSDNFFEIGGHSLKATQLLSRIYKEMNIRMELRDIFTYPTLGELATLLSVGNQTQYSEIQPLEPRDYYAVSHAQKRLWILDQLEEEQYAYNIPRAYKITGHLDVDAFKLAFHTLVSRHESLRTTFLSIDGVPYQQVQTAEAIGFELHFEDLRGEEGAEARAEEIARSESLGSFNLQTGPLLRARLLQVSEDKYVFVYTLHHIISDGWSEGVLVQEVLQMYEAYKAGKENPLAPLSIHYKDYAAWQNDQLSGDNLEVLRNYWLDQFSGELPVLNLPADYKRPKVKTYNGERVNFWLDKEELDKLKKMGRANDASLFMTLVACVNLLLYRFSGQEDLIVGSPVAGRDHVDLENQIGLYLNTLALRTRLKGRDSYQQLLSRVKDVVLGAFEHQAYPFDCIVQDLNLDRDQSRYPLFDVWVVLQNTSVRDDNNTQMNDLDFRTFDSAGVICNYDLKFGFEEIDEALFINFEYSTDLFAPETAAKFADALKVLLKTISDDPLSAIDDIELISEEEKQRQLAEEESKARKLVRRTRNVIQ